jgi:putative ABC transport system substrate-binding protein
VANIGSVIAGVAKDPQAGMIVVPHPFPFTKRDAVVAAMTKHRVPAIYEIAEMIRSGGLISYGQNLGARWRMFAGYIDQIVRGAKPAELPVQYATKYALAINAQAAKALSLDVSADMLKRADEAIDGA